MFRTVLFIGFGLNDPNFLRVFGEAGWLAGGYQGDAFSIMAHTTKPEREEWQRRGLRIIPLENYTELPDVINDLADKVIGIGIDTIVINALNKDFEHPRKFLTTNPFFQISSKWPTDFVREHLSTQHAGFSANFLESDDVWEPFHTTFREIGKTNHLFVTITSDEIDNMPEVLWKRMPCDHSTLTKHFSKGNKSVFGIHEADGLYTLLVIAKGNDDLKVAMTNFLSLRTIPVKWK